MDSMLVKYKIANTVRWCAMYVAGILLIASFFSCNKIFSKKETQKALIVYPSPPDQARFQYLTKITTSKDIGEGQSGFSKLVVGDDKAKGLVKPYGIAISNSKIYVCDNYGGGMEILDLENKRFDFFQPHGLGQMKTPINCFVDDDENLYVADAGRYEIIVFDKAGNYLRSFGEKEKFKPSDVAVYKDKIYVANIANSQINVYSKDSFKLLNSFPKADPGNVAFLGMPSNIAIKDDKVYVSDFGASRIKIYSTEGIFMDTIGSQGDRPGQFTKLKGIAVDDESNILAVDAAFENVQMFNKEGKLLMNLGGHYTGPGRGELTIPAKVIVDYDNMKYFMKYVDRSFDLKYLVFVTSQYGPDLINVYGRVEPKGSSSK
jgi:hypothetical protein